MTPCRDATCTDGLTRSLVRTRRVAPGGTTIEGVTTMLHRVLGVLSKAHVFRKRIYVFNHVRQLINQRRDNKHFLPNWPVFLLHPNPSHSRLVPCPRLLPFPPAQLPAQNLNNASPNIAFSYCARARPQRRIGARRSPVDLIFVGR